MMLPPAPGDPSSSVPGGGATGYSPIFFGLDDRARIVGLLGVARLGVAAWRWAWRAAERKRARTLPGESDGTRDLRVAVEPIALEVERISENQRFITKLLAERAEMDPAMLERGRSEKP